MQNFNIFDYSVIVVYFAVLVGLGVYLSKKASASMEDYFLGGRSLPWWALGLSGMASWLDVTGTMIITSFLFLLGPRGLFIEFRGGAVLIAAVCMLWTGKWHRRSQCITGAEWMSFRFGEGRGGEAARLVCAIGRLLMGIGMLTYMVKGVGLFLSMFFPFSPLICALILIAIAAVYTIASGFYGVVYTDVFQSGIVITAVILIMVLALGKVDSPGELAGVARQVTGNSQWITSSPQWHTEMPQGYECYSDLFMFALFYLMRNILGGMGLGDEPKYFGAKNDRECGSLTFLTVWCIMLRWPLMLGFAILGLYLVQDMFPDQAVLMQCSELIKRFSAGVAAPQWATLVSDIVNQPLNHPPELVDGLKDLLGGDWASRLQMVSFEGTVNAERVLPSVLLWGIPAGLRGMIMVALIAASMSTFDTHANMTTAFFTRDIYHRWLRRKASDKELVLASRLFILFMVLLAFLFAYSVKSINDIWAWLIMGLGTGLMVPGILRFYWWRLNGAGFALGTFAGMIGAVVQRVFWPDLDERVQFVLMLAIGTAGTIAGTFLTKPTDPDVVENFYRKTRPFGFWGRYKHALDAGERAAVGKEHRNDLLALPFAVGWQITLFLLPMQLMVGNMAAFWPTLGVFAASLAGLYLFWYRNLPVK